MDTSTVQERELRGWYSLGASFQPFSLVGTAVLGPLVLQQLAASAAFAHDDHSIPCDTSQAYHCDVPLFGTWLDTASLVLYANSASVVIQMLLFIPIGSMADYGNLRRFFVFFFSYLTVLFGLLILLVVNDSLYWLAFVSVNGAGICIGATSVFIGAYIPILTSFSAPIVSAKHSHSRAEEAELFELEANRISSNGIVASSVAGLALFALSAGFVVASVLFKWNFGLSSAYNQQIGMALCSIWQLLVLTFYSLPRVKARPGPPLPAGQSYISQSFQSLRDTLQKATSLRHCFIMLAGWFIYSDAFTTGARADS
ncbi:Autophagy protein 22 [Kappamyces sp. JEL0829]|nr:Autophagy protein 22 [Kappamyces sp. JEL0829]